MIKLTYNERSGLLLGEETYSSIDEVILYKENSFFTRKFKGDPCYRWMVVSCSFNIINSAHCIQVVCDRVTTSLEEKYLFKLNKESGGKTKRYIKVGSIIEVDIGFIPIIYRIHDGLQGSNKRYTDFIQKPEPHKRRMAVVVSNQGEDDYYMVVLVTSLKSEKINSIILSRESTDGLPKYNKKDSYVICDVVFPVSFTRILAPEVYNGGRKYRDNRFPTRVTRNDLNLIKEKICSVFELPYLTWVSKTNAEKTLLEVKINELERENEDLKSKMEILLNPLKYLYELDDVESVIDAIKKERSEHEKN